MAFNPNASTAHRHHDTSDMWQSSGQSRYGSQNGYSNGNSSSVSEKLQDMLGGSRRDSLPMYKDKPYAHLTGGRRRAWYLQKRTFGVLLTVLALVSWWFGILSPLAMLNGSKGSSGTKSTSSGLSSGWISKVGGKVDWAERANRVREVFKTSFHDYERHAWGFDEYHPASQSSKQMVPGGMGWIIVDALDTLMIMNLTTELEHAREWIHTSLNYDVDHDVNMFESTIRMLGGLLSAHYLSTAFPGTYAPVHDKLSDDLYVEKATDLADRLLSAFETRSGIPTASVNLHQEKGLVSHADGGSSSTAEATSVQLEFKYLAKLTGEDHYWHSVEKVMQVIDDNNQPDGLVPIFVHPDTGTFRGKNIRLGSRGDSYYEYLIKQYLQTAKQEPMYQAMWNESLAGVKKHLLTFSYPSNFTVLAERQGGLHSDMTPKMDHLVCFMPGTIALATTNGLPLAQARALPSWTARQDEDMRLAEELMKTCWGMYEVTPTGLAAEITYFHVHDPPLMYNDFAPNALPQSPDSFETAHRTDEDRTDPTLEDYIIKPLDGHNLQRPETVESLFYMWRITGDTKYREWGWKMFESFVKHTAVRGGAAFTSISDVMKVPPPLRDNMESFWLAETLKYFYLLFSNDDILPLTDVVFNTEAHPMPVFELNRLLQTGWKRKARDANGQIIPDAQPTTRAVEVEVSTQASIAHTEIPTGTEAVTASPST